MPRQAHSPVGDKRPGSIVGSGPSLVPAACRCGACASCCMQSETMVRFMQMIDLTVAAIVTSINKQNSDTTRHWYTRPYAALDGSVSISASSLQSWDESWCAFQANNRQPLYVKHIPVDLFAPVHRDSFLPCPTLVPTCHTPDNTQCDLTYVHPACSRQVPPATSPAHA